MTYKPQVGDRVRRTFGDGTTVEGAVYEVSDGHAYTKSGVCVFALLFSEETELIERPFKFNAKPGTVYGDPYNTGRRYVRLDLAWLASTSRGTRRLSDIEMLGIVLDQGLVEMDFEGNPL